MSTGDQDAVAAFLTQALSGTGQVETVTTHISQLFLAGSRVFKLKRAVRFPYLDFSTPERRLAACEAEVVLNRRTAPALYLGARRITRGPDGGLAFDGTGNLVDAVVEMRRFPQADLFDTLACEGRLGPDHIADLAQVIAAFHAGAEIHRDKGGAAALTALVDLNAAALLATGLASTGAVATLTARFRAVLARHAPCSTPAAPPARSAAATATSPCATSACSRASRRRSTASSSARPSRRPTSCTTSPSSSWTSGTGRASTSPTSCSIATSMGRTRPTVSDCCRS